MSGLIFAAALVLAAQVPQAGADAEPVAAAKADREPDRAPPGYELVFADEFNSGEMPDPAKWAYDTHRNAIGWYNNELQYYSADRPENARIENGNLVIEARRETLGGANLTDFGGQDYTSARLFTFGKAAWTYGFYEVRAKVPCARGTWSAIWMLPEDADVEWPDGGEIDIMEHVGFEPDKVHHSVHTKAFNFSRGTQRTTDVELATACQQFHRYQLLWTEEGLIFGIDDAPKFAFKKLRSGQSRWPFDEPMHLLLNVAVGGDWGGRKGVDDQALPAQMLVDHVRVYQKRN